MKLVKLDRISYFAPGWQGNGVSAGFSTRNGGVSRAPYNSLNLGLNTDDLDAHIEGNRSAFSRAFGRRPHQLLTVRQVHGQDVLLVSEANADVSHFQQVSADAVVTNQKNILVAVLVADCVPILLYDPEVQVGAAIHAGWRGAAQGLIGKTIRVMQEQFGCHPDGLRAAVGPGISREKYEVDRPVRDAFRKGSGNWELISEESRLGHWLLDLPRSCHLQLANAGLVEKHIEVLPLSTDGSREHFFSHRRDGGTTGRQAGFFMLSGE